MNNGYITPSSLTACFFANSPMVMGSSASALAGYEIDMFNVSGQHEEGASFTPTSPGERTQVMLKGFNDSSGVFHKLQPFGNTTTANPWTKVTRVLLPTRAEVIRRLQLPLSDPDACTLAPTSVPARSQWRSLGIQFPTIGSFR